MRRSTNSSRVAERLIVDSTPSPSHNERANTDTDQQLPTYDPRSDVAKKERSRLRFAENAIHAIPLLLVFCAVVLWFFSKPGTIQIAILLILSFFPFLFFYFFYFKKMKNHYLYLYCIYECWINEGIESLAQSRLWWLVLTTDRLSSNKRSFALKTMRD